MSFKKNTAVTAFSFGLVNASDGSDITSGTVTGYYTLDGGVQASIAGTPTHEGNGSWSVPLQASEMNGDIVGLVFKEPSAITTHFTIKTVDKLVSELKDETMRGTDGANTTTPPTSSAIATAVRTEMDLNSTKLDATISSRMGTFSYTAPDNASIASILADTNELQANQGNWLTATGFSTFNPAVDTVAHVTLVDTTTVNTDMRGTDNALLSVSYTAPDNASIASILADTNELQTNQFNVADIVSALNNLSAADVKTQVVQALTSDALNEPISLPSVNAPLSEKLAYMFAVASNKITQTDSLQTIRNRADTGNISTAAITSDGTTTTKGAQT